MNSKVSRIITNLTLVNRVVISLEVLNKDLLKNIIHYFNYYFSRLEEVILTN